MMLFGAMFVFGAGCVRRVVQITSDPDGAVVWMNDREVGSTPCEVEILHYGKYDVRVEKPGWEDHYIAALLARNDGNPQAPAMAKRLLDGLGPADPRRALIGTAFETPQLLGPT